MQGTPEADPSVFTRIIRGEIPSHRVYEDEHCVAFLDVGPVSRGHTLLVPREQKAHLHELSEASAAGLGRALPPVCQAVLQATGATQYNVLQNNGKDAGQSVFHVHFHIIPLLDGRGLRAMSGWDPQDLEADEAGRLAEAIRLALG